jgi:hypothetical protein
MEVKRTAREVKMRENFIVFRLLNVVVLFWGFLTCPTGELEVNLSLYSCQDSQKNQLSKPIAVLKLFMEHKAAPE